MHRAHGARGKSRKEKRKEGNAVGNRAAMQLAMAAKEVCAKLVP